MSPEIVSIPGVCEVQTLDGPGAGDAAPEILLELPHGATKQRHYDAARRRLASELPPGLEAFFFVNTDVGSPECASEIARLLLRAGGPFRRALIVRCLIPRTFIDCNRVLEPGRDDYRATGVTPVVCQKGSVGACGDLAPMSQIALLMMGEGEAFFQGSRMGGKDALDAAGIPIPGIEVRDGLAVINGSNLTNAIGFLTVWDSERFLKQAEIACGRALG